MSTLEPRIKRIRAEKILLSYGQMALFALIALAFSILVEPWIPVCYILLFLAASTLSTWYCGRWPGVASVALSVLILNYFYFEPKHSFALELRQIPSALLFTICDLAAVLWLSSEQRTFSKRLVENEENLRALVDGVREYALLLLDREGRVVTWNSGAQRIKGYAAEEIIGAHYSRFFLPEWEEHAYELLREAVRTGRAEEEGLRVRKDGSKFWANVVLTPSYDERGKLRGFCKVTRDVTDRKKAEEELEKQIAVSSIVESAPDAVVMVSEDSTILLFNRQAEKLFGYDRAEVLGQPIEKLVPAPQRSAHKTHRRTYAAHPQTRTMGSGLELYAQRKDGTVVPVEVSLSPVRHVGKNFVISTIRDISERKRTEKLVNETRIFELAQVIVRDLEGNILHWTTGAERLYGYTREEAVGSTSQLLLKTVFPESLAEIKQKLHSHGRWEGELIQQKRNGARIHVSSIWTLYLDEKGRPHRVLEACGDITNLKEAERKVLDLNQLLAARNEKLEKASALIADQTRQIASTAKMSALGEMAGGIAHEINNPIGIIHARVSDLRELAEESESIPSAAVIETMDRVAALVMRVARITKGMRKFARDANRDPFLITTVGEILEDTLSFCREKFRLHSVDLRLPAGPLDLTVECRATEISQVLLNLLNNALDAVDQMENSWVAIGVADQDSKVEISVTDSGGGIPSEIREKLTQPFFTTKEIGKGTGLGLSIVRGIVESHGGTFQLDVDSPNTCFRITLPKRQLKRDVFKEQSGVEISPAGHQR